jgi:hypothetical protein
MVRQADARRNQFHFGAPSLTDADGSSTLCADGTTFLSLRKMPGLRLQGPKTISLADNHVLQRDEGR